MGEIYCSMCDKQLQEHTVKNEQCCENMKLEKTTKKLYINHNENKFTIMRKSIIIGSITFIIQSSINVKGTIYKYPKMIKIRY